MAWFLYTGNVTVPVTQPGGAVVAVKPRTKVETDKQYVRKYQRWMRPCAPPKPGEAAAPIQPAVGKASFIPSTQARSIVEIGVVSSPSDIPGPTTPEEARARGVRGPSTVSPDEPSNPIKRLAKRTRKDVDTSQDTEAAEGAGDASE